MNNDIGARIVIGHAVRRTGGRKDSKWGRLMISWK